MHQITLASQDAYLARKPVVFLTSRVHCGETPAQYMLQGILEKLMDFEDVQTRALLDNYVFKIIPMLNPDGVSRGHWRFDIKGQNLNRKYNSSEVEKYPTILAAKQAVLNEHTSGNLKMFMDFHAHTSKRGCFIYGNTIECADQQAEAKMIPKLMSMNSVNFDFRSSSFQDEVNNVKDWQGDSRCGSSRAVIHRETGFNPLVYTIEANYARGKNINNLSLRYDRLNDEQIQTEDSDIQNSLSSIYGDTLEISSDSNELYRSRKSPAPDFTPEIWKDVGCSVLYALLDYDHINPVSRLVSSKDEDLQAAVQNIRDRLKANILKKREANK